VSITTVLGMPARFSGTDPGICVSGYLGREVDDLRVAAVLDVEHAVVGPAVFVVTDEAALGVGRQRGLAGAREPEEHRNAAVVGHVGRAVHREDALFGQAVVHQGEDRLLDLTPVARAADEDHELGQIEGDEPAGVGAVRGRVGFELGRVQDDRARLVHGDLLGRCRDEHCAGEQRVPRGIAHQAQRQAVLGVGAGEGVQDEQLTAVRQP
jgi:hypothetical protein